MSDRFKAVAVVSYFSGIAIIHLVQAEDYLSAGVLAAFAAHYLWRFA